LKDDEAAELERLARRFGRRPGATAALLLAEKLREEEFPFIEFRNSAVGRQAYVKGSRVTVWQIVMLARGLDMDARRVAAYLEWPQEQVQAALAYAAAYPQEIDPVVDEVENMTFERLKQKIPWLQKTEV
jgi:uncharacterized protein (DUF433 family)